MYVHLLLVFNLVLNVCIVYVYGAEKMHKKTKLSGNRNCGRDKVGMDGGSIFAAN